MEDMRGTFFDFNGVPNALHVLYSQGPLKVLARLKPLDIEGGQFFSGLDLVVGEVKVVIGTDGRVHVVTPDYHLTAELKIDTIDAPGHPGSTTDDPHPLQGIAHLNVTMPIFPAERPGESGIWVDGPSSAEHPADYVFPG